jgi:hypothetical protein
MVRVGLQLGCECVLGESYGTPLGLHGPLQRLADPPGRVGGEAEALAPVELLDRAHEAEGPLLDEVDHVDATSLIPACPVHHEAQVGADHLLAGLFVALFDPLGQLGLLGGAEKWEATEIVEEQPHQVRPTGGGLPQDATPLRRGQL